MLIHGHPGALNIVLAHKFENPPVMIHCPLFPAGHLETDTADGFHDVGYRVQQCLKERIVHRLGQRSVELDISLDECFLRDARVVPARLLTATVSADHRITDGAEVARFLQALKTLLEGGFALVDGQ